MKRYRSSIGTIELTDERLKHILVFHPEIRGQLKRFAPTLSEPAFIKTSRRDQTVLIFYGAAGKDKYLAIVVRRNSRNFILTAYLIRPSRISYENHH